MDWYWMARDASGNLFAYEARPRKGNKVWFSYSGMVCPLPPLWFPNVKWTDKRPRRLLIQESVASEDKKNTNIQI